MPFSRELRDRVDEYARQDLNGDLKSHVDFFDFLSDDPELQQRVGEEYYNARYIYKLWEGLQLDHDWSRRAQVQLQVQQYASIYEACLHHLLFTKCAGTPEVDALLSRQILRPWPVRAALKQALAEAPASEGRPVLAAVQSTIAIEDTKVRFDYKADTAVALGIIDQELADELKTFYAARNLIHIKAELQKGSSWEWKLEFARAVYWRLVPFKEQVTTWLASLVPIAAPRHEHI